MIFPLVAYNNGGDMSMLQSNQAGPGLIFVTLPAVFQSLLSFKQHHWLQHIAYKPYCHYCTFVGCEDETYDEVTGLSKAVKLWLPLLQFAE